MKLRCLFLALPLALTLLNPAATDAAVIHAGFGGTPSENPWDQYLGEAGGGWLGAWSQKSNSDGTSTINGQVIDSSINPLVSGQNYLQLTYNRTQNQTGASRSGIARQWDKNTVDPAEDYSVSFSVRFDDLTDFNATSTSNPVVFGATTADRSNGAISQGTSLWLIQISRTNGWSVVHKKTGDASASTFYFGSDNISFTEDTVYELKVDVLSSIGKYDVTINGVSASSLNGGVLFNLGDGAVSDFTWINWQTSMASLPASGVSLTYNIGDVTIQSIPESGTVGMAFGAFLTVAFSLYKSRR